MTRKELIDCLRSAEGFDDIDRYRSEIAELMPKISIMFGYDQKNTSHQFDLWGHCVHTVLFLPKNLEDDMMYLAALLHDIGKPDCQCEGKRPEDTNKHYYGHPERSLEIVRDEILPYLKRNGFAMSEEERQRLLYYIEYHDDRVSLRMKHLRRHLQMVSLDVFQKLMILQVADARAHVMLPVIEERIEICSQWAGAHGEAMYQKLLEEKQKKKGKAQ